MSPAQRSHRSTLEAPFQQSRLFQILQVTVSVGGVERKNWVCGQAVTLAQEKKGQNAYLNEESGDDEKESENQ